MATVNTVRGSVPCPHCGQVHPREVQFRYGHTWLLSYRFGDEIEWGEPSVGEPGLRKVIVPGWIDPACPDCGYEGDCELVVERDRPISVGPWSGIPELIDIDDYYVVER